VCCGVLYCVAACCGVLQYVAVVRMMRVCGWRGCGSRLRCVAICCNMLQYVAICYSIVNNTVVWRARVQEQVAVRCGELQCVTVCHNVLQCVAVCCSALHSHNLCGSWLK